jgi:nitric oxide reductase activation protein
MRNDKTTEKDLMFKELKKDSKGFVFRSSPKQVNKSTKYSSFWMNDENDEYNELFGVTENKGKDLVQLASYKRAISNFVNIVTGDSIPVTFNNNDESFTDGKKVVIGANLTEKNFDIAVGLALHEGSHIKLSDFNFLKNLEVNVPAEVFVLAEKKGFGKYTVLNHLKTLLNYVEDRRIDYYIFKSSPGYKGYYHAMYNKYFYSKVIDRMLLSSEMREESWESYEARIINLHNTNRQLGSLKGLKEIWRTINLKTIFRLNSSEDAYRVAEDVYRIILSNLSDFTPEKEDSNSESTGNGEDSENSETGSGSSSGGSDDNTMSDEQFEDLLDSVENDSDSSENMSNDDGSESKELSEAQKKQLQNALKKQQKFLDGDVQKTKMSKKNLNDIKAIDESGASYENVGKDVDSSYRYDSKGKGTKCLVVKKLTRSLIESNQFRCATSYNLSNYKSDSSWRSSYNFVEEGLRIGTVLGRKLQVRNEENTTKYTRKDSGRLDKRLIAELGFGNANVFSQTFVDKFNKVFVHLSIDASGSMSGDKWNKAMTSAVAMIKAADMVGNIEVVVSVRTTHEGSGRYNSNNDVPFIMVCYDSRVDKLVKVKSLFGALDVSGTTPEGLCFEAIMDELIPASNTQESYFINYSDGQPYYGNKEIYYSGHTAEVHTKKMVNIMREKGIKVLSYFIGGSYDSDRENVAFKNMYGNDAEFVNVTNVIDIARTMNKRFLTKN